MSGRGGFSVTISAADQASAKIDAINRKIASMRAPVDRVSKSIAKFGDTTGITALGKGMRDVAQHSLLAFENITRMVGPLGAITGAASVAGMAGLATEWARVNSQLNFSAQRAGMSATQLNALQGAARLAGSSAESLTAGMTALNDNLFNAAAGRAPDAIRAFQFLGISLRDNVTGRVRTATQTLPELFDKLAGIKEPAMQATLATETLGGAAEGLLPFIRRGSAGLVEYVSMANRYNKVTPEMTAGADRLRIAQMELGLSVTGLGNRIAQNLEPVLTPMLHDLAEWIKANPQTAAGIAKVAGEVALLVTGLGILRGAVALSGIGALARLLGFAIPAVAGTSGALIAGGAGVMLGAGAAAGGMQVPMVDEYGRVVGNWGGRDESKNPAAAPGMAAPGASLNPTQRGFLDTLAGPESGGAYNIRNGGGLFNDYSRFPAGIGPGGMSSAAGRYQFLSGTWGDVAPKIGATDFSPANQDRGAWYLAATTYRTKTGRDLEADLKEGGHQQQIAGVLGPIWPSLPGGSQSHETQEQFNSALATNTGTEAGIGSGTGASPAPTAVTLSGGAKLNISLGGFPPGTTTNMSATGNVWSGPPKVETAMALQ